MRTHHHRRTSILSGASAMALGVALASAAATPVLAQDEEAVTADRVTVTGSRIQRQDFTANSPIVTVEEDAFENRSSFNVEATLNQLPQFVPSGTTENVQNGAASVFPNATASPGAATLNLRGLGSNRSLVLVDGKRPQPINSSLVVDVNAIPAAAIQNVEVITGGAAAVYGADAIAGVVNFRLKRDFEGFELDAQYGVSEKGDNEQTQISGLVGGNFANGRGNAMAGLVWSERNTAYAADRAFTRRGWLDPGTTASGLGGTDLIRARFAGQYYGINPDGTLFNPDDAANPAAPFKGALNAEEGGAGFKLNEDGTLGYITPGNELSIPQTRYSIFTRAHYDLTDRISAFIEATTTHTDVSALSLVPEAFDTWALTIPYNAANDDPESPTFGNNPANWYPVSAELADALNGAGVTSWTLNQGLPYISDRMRNNTNSDIFQITAGFEGTLPIKDWTWEVYGSHGESTILSQMPFGHGSVSQANIQQLIDGVAATGARTATGPWGAGWNSGEILGVLRTCESGIPLFDTSGEPTYPISVTDDCIDYAGLEFNSATKLEQNIFEAAVQGGLFDLPAGELRFALGGTYREEYFEFNPDTGYSGQQARANAIGLILLPQSTSGAFDVKEIYGELLVPVIGGLPLVQQFDLELGGRYSDYSTTGGVETYKILADWTVNDWVRLRGGYQRANRAPNVYELFAPVGSNFSTSYDPCVNVPGYTPDYGNIADNPNRANLQVACAELISRDGGFDYTTILDDPNPGEPADDFPNIDQTHLSNYRYLLFGYNFTFPFNIAREQGNPNLDSEVADTLTAGVVVTSPFQSPWLERLNLSVDWYQIKLEGTIGTPTATVVYQQCLDAQYNPLIGDAPGSHSGAELLAGNPYCDLIERENINQAGELGAPGSGRDRTYKARYVNQGGTETSGIDVQVNWGAEFSDLGLDAIPGGLTASVVANFLLEFKESPFPGAAFENYEGTLFGAGYYDYTVLSTVNYHVGDASIGLRTRYLPEIDPSPTAVNALGHTASHTQFDLFGRWQLSDTVELRGGIDNLLDAAPEVTGRTTDNNSLGSTNAYYDQIGRRFFIGATFRM